MWLFIFLLFFVPFCVFIRIMIHDPRSMWSGSSFFIMMICLAFALFFILTQCSSRLASNDLFVRLMVYLLIITIVSITALPGILILMFFIEGIKIIRHEGIKPANLLSVLFSIFLFIYLILWPTIKIFRKNVFSRIVYIVISLSAIYILSLMTMYTLSAILNLVHLRKDRDADYIVVLGSGIAGDKVTPLLAARIEKGIELLQYNPNAALIMSGGQGPGETIPESEAMAEYAVHRGVEANRILEEQRSTSTEENLLFSRELMNGENPRIIIVTTSYHVFRALLLARQQNIKCVGFGSKTKWYFTLNALIREFAGYLRLTWRKHALVIGGTAGILTAVSLLRLF